MPIGNPTKQVGDFGEGLVTYALMRKGYLVACVNHVGADLIAEKDDYKIAVSVKTLLYREGSKTTQGLTIRYDHLKKLEEFSDRFGFNPVMANVVGIADDRIIHLFMSATEDIRSKFGEVKHGYRLRFDPKYLYRTIAEDGVDYSCWRDERIGRDLFKNAKTKKRSPNKS